MPNSQNLAGLNKFNLYTIINNTPDAIWCFDSSFILIAANKAFFQLWSANNSGEIEIGDSVFLHARREGLEKWQQLCNKALAGEVVLVEEIKQIGENEYFYETNITPVYDEDGDKKLIACVAISKDVSVRKRAEQAISAYGKRFKNFTFKTTHELRSPLANLLALIELGRDENITLSQLKQLFEMIDDSAQQLDGVVKEIITLMSKVNR